MSAGCPLTYSSSCATFTSRLKHNFICEKYYSDQLKTHGHVQHFKHSVSNCTVKTQRQVRLTSHKTVSRCVAAGQKFSGLDPNHDESKRHCCSFTLTLSRAVKREVCCELLLQAKIPDYVADSKLHETTRRSQQSQECNAPRLHRFCDLWPWHSDQK